jgi:malonyl-CoA/methylmalonyl-CoA synthetase
VQVPHPFWASHLAPGLDFAGAKADTQDTLASVWSTNWQRAPGAPTLRVLKGPGAPTSGNEWVSAGQLDGATRIAAARLVDLGVAPGNRVVWCAKTSLEAIVIALASLRVGATLVPANVGYTKRELTHIIEDVRPTLCVFDDAEQVTWVSEGRPSVRSLSVAEFCASLDPSAPVPEGIDSVTPEQPALIVYTSGTTGAPKGAVLSHANVVAGLEALRSSWGWQPDDRLVSALPLFHVHGLGVALLGTLHVGGSIVMLDRFDAAALIEAASSEHATLFFGVPTMYHRLVSTNGADALSRLRLCVSGSAPLSAELWYEAQSCLGTAVLERYGMSETMLTISNPLRGERRAGTVGLALPGTELALASETSGPVPVLEVPSAGLEGELFVRGPSVFSGYWDRPEANAQGFVDGWFNTSDIVSIASDGYVTIKGRTKELIISGGYNVYPAEIEAVLCEYPGVHEVAVTGTPSAEWGEAVTAWVVPSEGSLDQEALLAFAAQRLASYKRPRVVRLLDELPRTALGKVQRSQLS